MASANDPPRAGGSRPAILRDRRVLWTLIAGGVIVFVAAAMIGFSGAYFTSTSRSPGNEYVAAGMGLELARTGQIVDGAGMRPGDVRTGAQTVTNTGHLGILMLRAQGLGDDPGLASVLQVRIQRTAPAAPYAVYDGSLDDLGSLDLGRLAKDESRTYAFTVTWPAGQDSPDLAGQQVSLTFDWQLESVP